MTAPPERISFRASWLWLTAALILIGGFALRAAHLDAKDLWVDEAHPWHFATLPLAESLTLGFSGGPINSGADPLFNILLHFWIKLAGDSVYALRYLSVITNLLGVALLGGIARLVFGGRVGLIALAIGAVAPVWVFYAQEARPYAFTPALMLMMVDAVFRLDRSHARQTRLWAYLAIGEALSVYAHGFMIVGVAAINGWLAALAFRRWRQPSFPGWLRGWLLSQLAAASLLLPTLSLNLARSAGIQNPFAVSRSAAAFANELWAYLMGIPWEHVFDPLPLRVVAALILALMAAGLAVALRREGSRALADLVWVALGVGGLALLYQWRDASFHPRYALFLSGPILLTLAATTGRMVADIPAWRAAGIGLAALIGVMAAFSLDNLYTGRYPGYRHPSTRVVAETLRAEFDAQDAIVVVAPHDFTLDYYGTGSAPVLWSRFDEGIDQPADLLKQLADRRRIGVLRNNNERSDSRRVLPFYLERHGRLVQRQFFEGYDLSTYQLDPNAQLGLVEFELAQLNWGALGIDGVSIESGDSVTVAVRWAAGASLPDGKRYAASIRLVDFVTDWQISGADSLILGDGGEPTDRWQAGQTATQYFVLPLQPGTPPLDAELVITLYDTQIGQAVDLRDEAGAPAGQQGLLWVLTLRRAPNEWVYEASQRLWTLRPITSNALSGFVADKLAVSPGGTLGVTLAWTIPPASLAEGRATLQIAQGDQIIAEDHGPPLQNRPPADVEPGKAWLDRRLLSIAGDAQPGPATLRVIVNGKTIVLTELEALAFERLTERPAIDTPFEAVFANHVKLLGYHLDAPTPVTSESIVTLTLIWEALADGSPEVTYKVFSQMLAADGHLVGQHDSAPANDTRPFSGWLIGEYVIDTHPMTFNQPYTGSVTVQVGLYDPVTLERVLLESGEDAVRLPIQLQVESNP